MSSSVSRRNFLRNGTLAVAGVAGVGGTGLYAKGFSKAPAYIKNLDKPNSLINGVQVGAITYSFRSMPGSAEQLLKYCVDAGISAIELMGEPAEEFAGAPALPAAARMSFVPGQPRSKPTPEVIAAREEYAKKMAEWRAKVSMDKFEQLKKMYDDAGVSIYAFKPNALGVNNTDEEIDYALRAGKTLGANQVTVEYPTSYIQTARLGELASRQQMFIGYHGHLQQTYDMWNTAFIQSSNNRANLDMGHYVAAGYNPINFIETRHSHISSMHLKDRKTKAHGGANLPWGEGDTPIIEALQLIRDKKYGYPVTIELEYKIPDGSDAVKEVHKCLEYARKALEA